MQFDSINLIIDTIILLISIVVASGTLNHIIVGEEEQAKSECSSFSCRC
jgi:hypothetical protein